MLYYYINIILLLFPLSFQEQMKHVVMETPQLFTLTSSSNTQNTNTKKCFWNFKDVLLDFANQNFQFRKYKDINSNFCSAHFCISMVFCSCSITSIKVKGQKIHLRPPGKRKTKTVNDLIGWSKSILNMCHEWNL